MPIRYQSEIIDKIFDSSNNSVRTSLVTVDVQIGAVEIKDGTSDARAAVNSSNALAVAAIGNLTLSDSKGYIGLVTIGHTPNVAVAGNLTLSDSKGYIGLVTIGHTANVAVVGNLTLSNANGYIGLTSITGTVGGSFVSTASTWIDGGRGVFRGNVRGAGLSDLETLIAGEDLTNNWIRVTPIGNVTLSDSKGYIGLVTVGGIGTLTLADPTGFIGLVTIGGISQITLSDPKGYIGLVTTNPAGYSYNNFTGDGTVTVKSSAGILHSIAINTKSTGGTCVVYDSTVPSGTKIATIDTTLTQDTLLYDVNFSTGLTLDTSAVTTAGDLTISYK